MLARVRCIRAATRLEFTNVTILLAGAIEARAFGGDAGPRGSVDAPELDQLFASRARVSVSFGITSEVGTRAWFRSGDRNRCKAYRR
jgi:hypothetical protein